jgi:hypothetical protein
MQRDKQHIKEKESLKILINTKCFSNRMSFELNLRKEDIELLYEFLSREKGLNEKKVGLDWLINRLEWYAPIEKPYTDILVAAKNLKKFYQTIAKYFFLFTKTEFRLSEVTPKISIINHSSVYCGEFSAASNEITLSIRCLMRPDFKQYLLSIISHELSHSLQEGAHLKTDVMLHKYGIELDTLVEEVNTLIVNLEKLLAYRRKTFLEIKSKLSKSFEFDIQGLSPKLSKECKEFLYTYVLNAIRQVTFCGGKSIVSLKNKLIELKNINVYLWKSDHVIKIIDDVIWCLNDEEKELNNISRYKSFLIGERRILKNAHDFEFDVAPFIRQLNILMNACHNDLAFLNNLLWDLRSAIKNSPLENTEKIYAIEKIVTEGSAELLRFLFLSHIHSVKVALTYLTPSYKGYFKTILKLFKGDIRDVLDLLKGNTYVKGFKKWNSWLTRLKKTSGELNISEQKLNEGMRDFFLETDRLANEALKKVL